MLTHVEKIEVHLPRASLPYVVSGDGIEVEFADGRIVARSGRVELGSRARLVTSASPDELKVGDVVQGGPNKGWVYCETEQGEAFLVAPKDSGVMKWREAMDFAARENAELPSEEQLAAMYVERDAGVFKGTFNTTDSDPAGRYWSAAQECFNRVCCRDFRSGSQHDVGKGGMASARCVRRCSII